MAETILLTGATGNVGAVTLSQLLPLNHNVNIVLRSAKSIPFFKSKYSDAVASAQLIFTTVPDMTVPGVFDSAAATATAIFHIATPLASSNFVTNMVTPTWAVDHNLLEAAKKSKTVRRIVLCGTILQVARLEQIFDPRLTLSEKDFNDIELEDGVDEWVSAYQYAKTQAEHKIWAWMKANKSNIGFDLIMLLPPAITGRSPQEAYKPSADNPGGIGGIYKALMNGDAENTVDSMFPIWMDTDDVARSHILSLNHTKVPGNERYLLASSEILDLRAIANTLRKKNPELVDRLPAVKELPISRLQGKFATIDTSKVDKLFGTDWKSAFKSVEETVADVVRWEKENAR